MKKCNTHICPVERSGSLDNRLRKLIQNPKKILGPYLKEGMTVIDVGCGPGFFIPDTAKLVGASGKVIACDLQEGMLEKVKKKVQGTIIEPIVDFHKCGYESIGFNSKVDFAILFYMVHEVPNAFNLFTEIKSMLNPKGKVLIVEPSFHVSNEKYEASIKNAEKAGFKVTTGPKIFLSKTVILE